MIAHNQLEVTYRNGVRTYSFEDPFTKGNFNIYHLLTKLSDPWKHTAPEMTWEVHELGPIMSIKTVHKCACKSEGDLE